MYRVPNVMAIHAIAVEILHSKPPMWTSWWSYQSLRIHSSGTMIVSTKFHGIPTNGCSDIMQWTVRLPFMQPYMPLLCLKPVASHSFCLHFVFGIFLYQSEALWNATVWNLTTQLCEMITCDCLNKFRGAVQATRSLFVTILQFSENDALKNYTLCCLSSDSIFI